MRRVAGRNKTAALPANFALHKLIVLTRIPTTEKQMKDKEAAVRIFKALVDKGQGNLIRNVFHTMPHTNQLFSSDI